MLFALLDRKRAPPPSEDKAGWLRQWRFAHRGLHGPGVPENSAAAFDLAVQAGVGIECDVHRSRDGHAVVFHDDELDRLTGETGPITERSAEELSKIRLAGGTDPIHTLRWHLKQIAGKVPLLIEIKSHALRASQVTALCLAVRREIEGYGGHVAVMSFDPRVVRWFADRSPLTLRGLVVTEENARALPGRIKRRMALWHARPEFLVYDIRDLPSRFAARHRARGLPLLTWTVRNAELAERAAAHADAPIAEGAGLV